MHCEDWWSMLCEQRVGVQHSAITTHSDYKVEVVGFNYTIGLDMCDGQWYQFRTFVEG